MITTPACTARTTPPGTHAEDMGRDTRLASPRTTTAISGKAGPSLHFTRLLAGLQDTGGRAL